MTTNSPNPENHITVCEARLLNAFTQKDLNVLNELIHDEALFILPNGMTVTKPMVLENYRKGDMAMTSITPSDQKISFAEDTAIVSVNLEMTGKYQDRTISSNFRYLRVWKLCKDQWRVIAVSGISLDKPV